MGNLQQFEKQQYLNIETFRKNGAGEKTPVWFVQDGNLLYVRTIDNSGKVKRIRNNSQVLIAPFKMNGKVVGDWVQATAIEKRDEAIAQKVDKLLAKKYGLMKKMFTFSSTIQKKENTILEIILN